MGAEQATEADEDLPAPAFYAPRVRTLSTGKGREPMKTAVPGKGLPKAKPYSTAETGRGYKARM